MFLAIVLPTFGVQVWTKVWERGFQTFAELQARFSHAAFDSQTRQDDANFEQPPYTNSPYLCGFFSM